MRYFVNTTKKLFGQKTNLTTTQQQQQQETKANNQKVQQQSITKDQLLTKQQKPKIRPKWAQKSSPTTIIVNQSSSKHVKQQQQRQQQQLSPSPSMIDQENKPFYNNNIKQTNKNKSSSQFLSSLNKKSSHPERRQAQKTAQQLSYREQQQQQQQQSFAQTTKSYKNKVNNSNSNLNSNYTTTTITAATQRNSQSYNLRSCELLLYQFKDIAKQSKNFKQLIRQFHQFNTKLKQQHVQLTGLRDKHKSIMYSAMMRAFARILRRQNNPDRGVIVEFLGQDYQQITYIPLDCLKTLQLSDFVSFFFIFQLMGSYRSISQQKQKVVERYLASLYNRYKQNKGMSYKQNEKQLASEQKMQKRYMSEVILGARCAQLFNSFTYENYLDLIIDHISTQKLVPYKMVSILKFIMRGQCSQENNVFLAKQLILLQKIVQKIQSSNVLQQMDVTSLRELYGNIVAIMGNNNSNNNPILQRVKHAIKAIQQQLIQTIHLFPSQQIHHITSYALNSNCHEYKLVKFIYSTIFSNINQHGQTSINPLFIVMIVSTLDKKVVQMIQLQKIEPKWEMKLINLVRKYLVGQRELTNLSYCSEYVAKLVANMQQLSKQLYTLLIKSIINNSLIVPYDHQSLLVQNHYLTYSQQNSLQKIYATLYRLKNARSYLDKKVGLYDSVFGQLQSGVTSDEKNDIIRNHKSYIQSIGEIKRNRQGYVRTLSKLCIALKKQHLIPQLFNQSLLHILKLRSQKLSSLTKQSKHQQNFLVSKQIKLGYKDRQKIYSLICNYFTVILKLKPKFFSIKKDLEQLKQQNFGQMIKKDKFIQSIQANEQINKLFLQALASKEKVQLMKEYFYLWAFQRYN